MLAYYSTLLNIGKDGPCEPTFSTILQESSVKACRRAAACFLLERGQTFV